MKSTCKGQGQAGESQSSECWLGSYGTERISFYQNFAIIEENTSPNIGHKDDIYQEMSHWVLILAKDLYKTE